MKFIRQQTLLSLNETKHFVDIFRRDGKAEIPESSFINLVSLQKALSWKKELEDNKIAKLEVAAVKEEI